MKLKKITAGICAMAIAACTVCSMTASAGNVKYGDVDLNGRIDVTDVVKVAGYVKSIHKLDKEELRAADANGDGKVNATDISVIAAHVKNIRPIESRFRLSVFCVLGSVSGDNQLSYAMFFSNKRIVNSQTFPLFSLSKT